MWERLRYRKFLVFIYFLEIIQYTPPCIGIPENSVAIRKPEIFMIGYEKRNPLEIVSAEEQFRTKNEFQNDFLSKIGNDYVLNSNTSKAVFSCEADYPVTWKFPFPKQLILETNQDLKSNEYRISNFSHDDSNPVNNRFKITIGFDYTKSTFASVNVSCISAQNSAVIPQSSFHLFVGKAPSLEHQGKTLNITVDPAKQGDVQALILPCRPSSPNLKIALEEASLVTGSNASGTHQARVDWKLVSNDSDLTYDPKQGFTLKAGLRGKQTVGLYRCSIVNIANDGKEKLDVNRFVLVNVTSNPSATRRPITPFKPVSTFNGTAKVTKGASVYSHHLRAHPGPIIKCCSGLSNKPPKLYMNPCTSPIDCEIKKIAMPDEVAAGTANTFFNKLIWHVDPEKSRYSSSDCVKTFLVGPSALVVCKGETVDYSQQFMHIFNPEAGGPVENRRQMLREADKTPRFFGNYVLSLSNYDTEANASKSNVTERMVIIVGGASTPPRAEFLMNFINMHDPLLKTAENSKNPSTNRAAMAYQMRSATIITEYDQDSYYDGESLILMCFGVQFFYANGPRLRLNWRNGTKTNLENATVSTSKILQRTRLILSRDTVMFDGWGEQVVSIFGIPVVASTEMSSVDCWMPVRNSGKWDKISKSLKVLPTVAPRFAEEAEETVNIKEGHLFHPITCTVVEGAPFPSLQVTKNGILRYDFRRDMKTAEKRNATGRNLITANIHLRKVKQSDQAVWRCVAENFKGTATRTVKVVVEAGHKPAVESMFEVDVY